MGLQQRNGNVPGAVGLAQEADELGRDLGLWLAQRYALQQRLAKTSVMSKSSLIFTSNCYTYEVMRESFI